MTEKGYGLFGELTLEGYVGEYFGVSLHKKEAPGGGTVLKVTPKTGQTGITSGVFETLSEKYTFVGVRITEFGTLEATFDPKIKITEVDAECHIYYSDGTMKLCEHVPSGSIYQECGPGYGPGRGCAKWDHHHVMGRRI